MSIHIIMRHAKDPDTGDFVTKPACYVTTGEADARKLASRLGRITLVRMMLVSVDPRWQGADHNAWLTAATAALHRLDPGAPPFSRYSIETAPEFNGPDEDATPVMVSLMTGFAQHSSEPPATPHDAVFRLIRDGGVAPEPEPGPEPEDPALG